LSYTILSDGLYILQCQQKLPSRQSLSTITKPNQFNSIDLWHQRLGHISEAHLRLLAPTYSLHFQENAKLKFCSACALGKAKQAPTSKGPIPPANQPLQLISTDIFSPFPPSIGGTRYYCTFVDSHSQSVTVAFLKRKSEFPKRFKRFKELAESIHGHCIQILQLDPAGENHSNDFCEYLELNGI